MSDLIIFAGGAIALAVILAYAFIALNRSLSQRRETKLRKHLNWNGNHHVPRVSAARRA